MDLGPSVIIVEWAIDPQGQFMPMNFDVEFKLVQQSLC